MEGRPATRPPAYTAPEQGWGSPLDARSDIFTLGVLLYQMLARRSSPHRTPDKEMRLVIKDDSNLHAHKRSDPEKFFPT